MNDLKLVLRRNWKAISIFAGLITSYHIIFGQYYPSRNGTLGHDWSGLAGVLANYFWYKNNGVGVIPAFFPSVCPVGGEIGVSYYLPWNLLSYAGIDPLTSIYINILLFVSLGFWGTYALLLNRFCVSWQSATLGAALYMFNGFFTYRAMIGHGFYGVMLVPWVVYFLINPIRSDYLICNTNNWKNGVLAGVLAAIAATVATLNIIIFVALSIILMLLLYGVLGGNLRQASWRVVIAGVISAGLVWNILAPTILGGGLSNSIAARVSYSLPGAKSLADSLVLAFKMLFVAPADIWDQAQPVLTNMQWSLERHSLEYGLTVVPLVLILVAGGDWLWRWVQVNYQSAPMSFARKFGMVSVALILCLPIVYTTYFSQEWNAFLKRVPLLNATVDPYRSFFIYVPFLALAAGLIADRQIWFRRYATPALLVGLIIIVGLNATKQRDYYDNQPVDPKPQLATYSQVKAWKPVPAVMYVGAFLDANRNLIPDQQLARDAVTQGVVTMGCYAPWYSSASPELIKTLHPGSVWDVTDGMLNIKNPACFVYPKENNCQPGDHFKVEERAKAEAYLNYKPFPFERSTTQIWANRISMATLILVMCYLALSFWLQRRNGRINDER